jgi:hypothetical protein
MPLMCFHFPGNIVMFLPPDWLTRSNPPIRVLVGIDFIKEAIHD